MAVYTELSKTFLEELVDDYSFGRISNVVGIPEGSVNTNYLLETAKGKFLVRIDEVKGESEVRREIDLLAFLRKHTFPCPHPLQDRMGRFYRDYDAKCVSIYRYHEGRVLPVMRLRPTHLETIRRTLGDLHVIRKDHNKGTHNPFSCPRIVCLHLSRPNSHAH